MVLFSLNEMQYIPAENKQDNDFGVDPTLFFSSKPLKMSLKLSVDVNPFCTLVNLTPATCRDFSMLRVNSNETPLLDAPDAPPIVVLQK